MIGKTEISRHADNVLRDASSRVDRLAQRIEQVGRPYLWLALLCLLLVLPAIVLRGAHHEEGTAIALARGAFEDGHWWTPFQYGLRFPERPVLFSWLLASIGLVTGTVTDWVARIPVALSLFGGASLVFYLVRQYASIGAGVFGALCFVASPIVFGKVVTAETDVFVSVLLFAAFVVLWDGERRGGASVWRWLALALMLSATVLVKGPPPLGFFFLGFGAFFLLRRRWAELFKLVLVWLAPLAVIVGWYVSNYRPADELHWIWQNRLEPIPLLQWIDNIAEFSRRFALGSLPGWLLLIPLAGRLLRPPASKEEEALSALALYAGICVFLLIFWPGSRARYAMPAIPAIAAAAGIAFHLLRASRPRLIGATSLLIAGFLCYRLVLNWVVMPLVPEPFQRSRHFGHVIAEAVAARPGTIYFAYDPNGGNLNNLYVYVPYKIRVVGFDAIAKKTAPFWAIMTSAEERHLRALRPSGTIIRQAAAAWPRDWVLLDVRTALASTPGASRQFTARHAAPAEPKY